jgi:hypothetical protein
MQLTQQEAQPGTGQGNVPAKGSGAIDDSVFEALLKMSSQENIPHSGSELSASQYKERVLKGREDLKKQDAIGSYFQKLRLIDADLLQKQKGLKPEEYFAEGLKQVIGEPIGAALIQNLLEDFPLPQNAATYDQKTRQFIRTQKPPGVQTPEDWAAYQTLRVLRTFDFDKVGAIVKPNPEKPGDAYPAFRQGRGEIVNILRPTITRALPK